MTKIIGLAGYAQSGKDTVAETLVNSRGYVRIAFADALRDAMYTLNPYLYATMGDNGFERPWEFRLQDLVDDVGWDEAKKDPEVRRLLQVFGTEVGRQQIADTIWVDIAMRKAHNHALVVFTDVRFPNEFGAIKDHGGQVFRIVRHGVGPVNRHASETALDGFEFDGGIINDGTLEDLHIAAVTLGLA